MRLPLRIGDLMSTCPLAASSSGARRNTRDEREHSPLALTSSCDRKQTRLRVRNSLRQENASFLWHTWSAWSIRSRTEQVRETPISDAFDGF